MTNILYEKEKNKLIKLAEAKFGKDYFDSLNKHAQNFKQNLESKNYNASTNYKGAFYAD